jgi:hypothetical protein
MELGMWKRVHWNWNYRYLSVSHWVRRMMMGGCPGRAEYANTKREDGRMDGWMRRMELGTDKRDESAAHWRRDILMMMTVLKRYRVEEIPCWSGAVLKKCHFETEYVEEEPRWRGSVLKKFRVEAESSWRSITLKKCRTETVEPPGEWRKLKIKGQIRVLRWHDVHVQKNVAGADLRLDLSENRLLKRQKVTGIPSLTFGGGPKEIIMAMIFLWGEMMYF